MNDSLGDAEARSMVYERAESQASTESVCTTSTDAPKKTSALETPSPSSDSLFGGKSESSDLACDSESFSWIRNNEDEDVALQSAVVASRCPPAIPGLLYFENVIPMELASRTLSNIVPPGAIAQSAKASWPDQTAGCFAINDGSPPTLLDPEHGCNQAMLFAKARGQSSSSVNDEEKSGFPAWTHELLEYLSSTLGTLMDSPTFDTLFASYVHRSCSATWNAQKKDENRCNETVDGSNETYGCSEKQPKKRRRHNSSGKGIGVTYHDDESAEVSVPTTSSTMASSLAWRLRSRQLIINHYEPGQGIGAHVDLVSRFDDGILLCSLAAGIVMEFTPCDWKAEAHDVSETTPTQRQHIYALYLPPCSVLALTGEARYRWKHSIPSRDVDWVYNDEKGGQEDMEAIVNETIQYETDANSRYTGAAPVAPALSHKHRSIQAIKREPRVSITIRWLLPGADIVGSSSLESEDES